jgi:hypothetical protein
VRRQIRRQVLADAVGREVALLLRRHTGRHRVGECRVDAGGGEPGRETARRRRGVGLPTLGNGRPALGVGLPAFGAWAVTRTSRIPTQPRQPRALTSPLSSTTALGPNSSRIA